MRPPGGTKADGLEADGTQRSQPTIEIVSPASASSADQSS